ncbi:MAG: ABC transporter ATP-binding protein [Actinomycetota bacterium]
MDRTIIRTRNLVKTFEGGKVKALDGVNLEVPEGEFVSIMGPSGSGKSTLLNMIGALDHPTEGKVIVDDVDLSKVKNLDEFRAKKVGFIFQLHNLIPTLTALENVEIPMFELGLSKRERRERAKKLLELVGLGERLNYVPTKLSGGERQRVAIARALANNPKIILADELTGNLDSASSDEILHLLLDLNQRGQTIVLVTHDQEMAEHANVVYHLKDGKILETLHDS